MNEYVTKTLSAWMDKTYDREAPQRIRQRRIDEAVRHNVWNWPYDLLKRVAFEGLPTDRDIKRDPYSLMALWVRSVRATYRQLVKEKWDKPVQASRIPDDWGRPGWDAETFKRFNDARRHLHQIMQRFDTTVPTVPIKPMRMLY